MDSSEWDKLNEIVVECSRALFAACGVHVDYAGVATKDDAPFDTTLAVIGYGGAHLRGSVLLSAPTEVLRATHPSGGAASDDDLLDWAGELSNLLLGRIKNAIRRYGLVIEMSTPLMFSGLHLRISSVRSSNHAAHRFSCGEAHKLALGELLLQVRFEANVEPGARLTATSEEPPAGSPRGEGDVILF